MKWGNNMLSNAPRCIYQHNQLIEVICQLRFPEILSIEANAPFLFQEIVRSAFPNYSVQKELSAPKLTGVPGNMQVEPQQVTNNYQFISTDGIWKINLTSKFISLSCNKYTCWEDFAKRLDLPLAAFIKVYKPTHFERIGLRYINAISRQALEITETPFHDLLNPIYLGPLDCLDIPEKSFHRCGIDFEVKLSNQIIAKVHSGPGIINRNGKTDPEPKFIFDEDLFVSDIVPINQTADTLESIHGKAFQLFRGAITKTLHNTMGPNTI